MDLIHGVGAGFRAHDLVAAGLALTSFGVMLEYDPERTLNLLNDVMHAYLKDHPDDPNAQANLEAFESSAKELRENEEARYHLINPMNEMATLFGVIVDDWEEAVHAATSEG